MTRPSVRYTHDFIRNALPDGARRIIEIGCGSGELAALLMADGLQVTAIDADAECVRKAREIGVDARTMCWPAPLDERFDAVLFTHSLHHVADLQGGIQSAAEAIEPGGRIIVEDFRAEGAGDRSTGWYAGVARLLIASEALSEGSDLNALLEKAAPSSTHDHHLHSSGEIAHGLRRLGRVIETDAAYYFRYLEPCLSDGAAEALLEHELEMIAAGAIDALGKRFVVSVG